MTIYVFANKAEELKAELEKNRVRMEAERKELLDIFGGEAPEEILKSFNEANPADLLIAAYNLENIMSPEAIQIGKDKGRIIGVEV